MTRHDLWSTPIWHIEGAPQQLVDELYQGAYKFKERYPSVQKTNQGGYQSPSFNWKEFHPQGIEYINNVISKLIEDVESPYYKNVKVQEWWYNINEKGCWNIPHTHPGSDLALVLYLTDSDGLLSLLDPYAYRGIYPQIKNMNAKKGDILIFPSDLMHFVMPNQREEDRICISMNLQLC